MQLPCHAPRATISHAQRALSIATLSTAKARDLTLMAMRHAQAARSSDAITASKSHKKLRRYCGSRRMRTGGSSENSCESELQHRRFGSDATRGSLPCSYAEYCGSMSC